MHVASRTEGGSNLPGRPAPGSALPRHPHAILVLGFPFTQEGRPSAGAERRLRRALEEAQRDPQALVVVTGGAVANDIAEGPAMRDWLVKKGISPGRIVVEDQALNTVDNVEFAAPLLKQAGASRVTLVTEAFHVERSRALLVEALRFRGIEMPIRNVAAPDGLSSSMRTKVQAREKKALQRALFFQGIRHAFEKDRFSP